MIPLRILFVVPYVPSPIYVRPFNLIRHLTGHSHKVTVATLWTKESDREDLQRLGKICQRVLAIRLPRWRSLWNAAWAVPGSTPLQAVYCWQPRLVSHIQEILQPDGRGEFDIAHVEHLRGAQYGLLIKNQARPDRLPVVWDSVDSISHLFRQASTLSKRRINRWITRFELGRTERYESWLINQFDRTLVTSPVDRTALASLAAPGETLPPISVLPNGVDSTYFAPNPETPRKPASLVVSGKMSYHANVTMVLHLVTDILPLIWAERPDVTLWIVGKNPTREIQALAKHPAITVTGTVSDLRPYLQQATIAVAPVAYGAGIQNKVLEAMACATPVVATSQAVSALDIQPGQEVLVAANPADFAQAVLGLLADLARQRQIGRAGRKFVENHQQWGAIASRLEEIYRQALAGETTKAGGDSVR